MASQQVHDATGKICRCGKAFDKGSFNITITQKEKWRGCLVKEKVCGACHHEYMSKGE